MKRLDAAKALHRLNTSMSWSPGNIPAYFLKQVGFTLLHTMIYLFNLALHLGVISNEWKRVIITLLYKKGSCEKPINYKPVSLTLVMCHILQSIIAEKVMVHLLSNDLLSDSQFRFFPDRSTCTQLLAALNNWYNSYNFGLNIHIVYTDISKAFNTVSHIKLLSVLKSYSIANNTFDWLHAFIADRCQCVYIDSVLSSFYQ